MNILIIEDNQRVAHIIQSILNSNGFNSEINLKDIRSERQIKDGVFEICLVNSTLDIGTVGILKRLRMLSNGIYVIGISTKSTWKEKVDILNNGADDVLDYPFPMQELLARINSLMRRPKENTGGILKFKNFNIDNELKQVTYKDREIPLRRREFTLFEYMVKNKNRTVSRAELLDHVWDYRRATGSNTVDVHVKRLRDKLMDRDVIKTVHGFGYTVIDNKKKQPDTTTSLA